MDLRAKVKLSAGLCSFLENLGEKLLPFPVSPRLPASLWLSSPSFFKASNSRLSPFHAAIALFFFSCLPLPLLRTLVITLGPCDNPGSSPYFKCYDQPRQHIKKQRHYFANKGLASKSYGFSSSHVGCESWTIRKAECRRIDAFELWCWRRLLRVPWTARRSNQSILKEISSRGSSQSRY